MANFIYTALSVDGRETKGEIDALNPNAATALLRERGLFVVNIAQGTPLSTGNSNNKFKAFIANNRSVSKRDLVFSLNKWRLCCVQVCLCYTPLKSLLINLVGAYIM